MPLSDVRISGGIFLFSFTYWSNCWIIVRRIASVSLSVSGSLAIGVTCTVKCVLTSSMLWMRARWLPQSRC
jgi:hypothetical protein